MKPARLFSPALVVPALALAGSLATVAPARAGGCIQTYAECLVEAAELDTWWQRSAAGLDCYADAVACVRDKYF